ncbi:MAG: hypothetical protein ACRCTA_01765 [Bacilli bacterium]
MYQSDQYTFTTINTNEVLKRKISNSKEDSGSNDFKIGDLIIHHKFKKGVILNISGDVLTIAFDKQTGIKNISQSFVAKIE